MEQAVSILLVEDDPSMLDGMKDLLEMADIGYKIRVFAAGNGKAALEVMARHAPDLIVSDIMMPQMDGFQFLEKVRQNPAWIHIPFVFLTAKGEKQDYRRGRLTGADLYITKPFNTGDFLELIGTQLNRALKLRLARQQNVENLKKNILQVLNHEFRTPLTYVTAYYEMLAESLDMFTEGHNYQEYLRGIQAGCVRLTKLVEDFILLIELRSGEARATYNRHAHPINHLGEVLETVVQAYQRQGNQQGILVHYAAPAHLPAVFGDEASVRNIFERLLDNAVKFTHSHQKQGGNVHVSVQQKDQEVQVTIQDEGKGIPPHIQGQLFDLFFQYNRGLVEQQGTGAGLTIVKGLIDLHQGRIEVESQEGGGSKFTVILPIYTGESEHAAISLANGDGRKQATVLAVEDDRFLLAGLEDLLKTLDEKYQLNVLTAVNGKAGLEALEKHVPDLIISDIMMPQMDGYEFLRQVRQNPEWFHIPFIFLTARGERHDLHEGFLQGVEEYVTKPYDSDELLGLVVKQLDRYFQAQGTQAQNFNALKKSILNLVTPDFRVPLASVSRYSEELGQALGNAQTDEELKSSLRGIQAGSVRLTRLIEDFISLAELKTGEAMTAYSLRAQPITNISLLLTEVSQRHDDMLEAKGFHVHCTANPQLPLVYGDTSMISDSLRRLIEVGTKCCISPIQKDIYLSVSSTDNEVHLSARFPTALSEDKVEQFLSILAEDDLELFEWPDYTPSLSIVKGYAGLHGGRVEMENDPDSGCTFTIILPVHT
jgi:signal transduction histidine kinase